MRAFKLLAQMGSVIYLQEFVPHEGYDVRVLLIGDEVYAVCAASQTLAVGDLVESNGAGALQAHVPASAGAPLEYPESVVGIVKVAVTTGSATGRICLFT